MQSWWQSLSCHGIGIASVAACQRLVPPQLESSVNVIAKHLVVEQELLMHSQDQVPWQAGQEFFQLCTLS